MEDINFPTIAKIDIEAPSFDLPFYDPKTDSDGAINSNDLKWKWVVLFFYPADFTFVCPTELKDIAEQEAKFKELWVEVLAASTDTVFSHRAWVKHERLMEWFPFKMLADHSTEVAYVYNLLDEESGISGRGTYIIDPDGIIRSIEVTWDTLPLGRNSAELIRKLEALQYMRENPTQACPARWAVWSKTLTPDIKIAWEVYEALND